MNKIRSHVLMALVSIIPVYVITFFLSKIMLIQRGHALSSNFVAGHVMVILYALYLICVSIYYFRHVTVLWREKAPWQKELIKSYLLLLLFSIYTSISFVVATDSQHRVFTDTFGSLGFTLWYMPLGLLITLPVNIYIIYLAIKSLIKAKEYGLSHAYGIVLLLITLAPLLAFGLLAFIMPRFHWGFA